MRGMKTTMLACGVLAALVSLGAVSEEGAFERARALATEKRYAEAWELLGPLLEREPSHAQGRLLHGVLRAREGRLGEAIRIFEALRREYPDMSEPHNNLAVLYALAGRLEAAREALLSALEQRPVAVAYANLGDVYTGLARRAYERALEMEGEDGDPGSGKPDTAVTMPVPPEELSEAVPRGGTPESGFAMTKPAGAIREATELAARGQESAAGTRDAASEPREVAGEEQAPAASGVRDTTGAVAVPAGSKGAARPAFCAYAGGFEGRRAVADAALWLQSYGAEVLEVRHEEWPTASRYWVYLPPFASRERAQAKLREIRGRGVRDVAVIPSGELANGISFGLYREAANVRRRVAAVERLGYAVRSRIEEAERVAGYVVKARAAGAVAAIEAAWSSRFPEQRLQVVDCG